MSGQAVVRDINAQESGGKNVRAASAQRALKTMRNEEEIPAEASRFDELDYIPLVRPLRIINDLVKGGTR